MTPISDFELGWLVGILEGEGYFGYRADSKTHNVTLRMTDEDTMLKYLGIVTRIIGKIPPIVCIEPTGRMTKAIYSIQIHGESARTIMRLVVRSMSDRRRVRIWQSLNCVRIKQQPLDMDALVSQIVPLRKA